MNPGCVWYVSGFKQPWEADVIGNLAEAVMGGGTLLRVYAKGGTARLHVDGVMSWESLTFFERAKAVFSKSALWHLWGDAPFWWGLVRLRSRTVHTSLSPSPKWRGHPTRFFKAQAKDGENRILPTFEPKADWSDSCGESGALVIAWNGDDSARKRKDILSAWEAVTGENESFKNSRVFVTDSEPANALHAAYMTMRGVPVAAPDTPLMREVLGAGGYVAAPSGDEDGERGWEKTLRAAASETGRSISAAARYFLKENYGAPAAAESLKSLYEAVSRGGV